MAGEISGPELEDVLATDGESVEIVDIRSPTAFARTRIASSVNVPLGELPAEVHRFADADRVVTVCPHGKASVRAARLIESFEGFDGTVESLSCGLEGWEGPVSSDESGDDAPVDAPF